MAMNTFRLLIILCAMATALPCAGQTVGRSVSATTRTESQVTQTDTAIVVTTLTITLQKDLRAGTIIKADTTRQVQVMSLAQLAGATGENVRFEIDEEVRPTEVVSAEPRAESASDDRALEMEAFEFLNNIRANPASYAQEVGTDHMKSVEARPALAWNETLAQVARDKARDMARRDYFAHVDPDGYGMNYFINKAGYSLAAYRLKKKSENNFESIACGTSTLARQAIIILLYDDGASNAAAGHRRHLLGIPDGYARCRDVGIGHHYDPGSRYGHYWCILVARHD